MQPLVRLKVRIRSLIEKGKNCLFLFFKFLVRYIVRNDHRRCKEIMVQRFRLEKRLKSRKCMRQKRILYTRPLGILENTPRVMAKICVRGSYGIN